VGPFHLGLRGRSDEKGDVLRAEGRVEQRHSYLGSECFTRGSVKGGLLRGGKDSSLSLIPAIDGEKGERVQDDPIRRRGGPDLIS